MYFPTRKNFVIIRDKPKKLEYLMLLLLAIAAYLAFDFYVSFRRKIVKKKLEIIPCVELIRVLS